MGLRQQGSLGGQRGTYMIILRQVLYSPDSIRCSHAIPFTLLLNFTTHFTKLERTFKTDIPEFPFPSWRIAKGRDHGQDLDDDGGINRRVITSLVLT